MISGPQYTRLFSLLIHCPGTAGPHGSLPSPASCRILGLLYLLDKDVRKQAGPLGSAMYITTGSEISHFKNEYSTKD